jgi:hypothetical protein
VIRGFFRSLNTRSFKEDEDPRHDLVQARSYVLGLPTALGVP